MRTAILAAALLIATPLAATAHHLGPIVFGVERTEVVVACLGNHHLKEFVDAEEKSVREKGDIGDFFESVRSFLEEDGCIRAQVTYTATKELYRWVGREFSDGTVKEATVVAVEAIAKTRGGPMTIYVISPDPPEQK